MTMTSLTATFSMIVQSTARRTGTAIDAPIDELRETLRTALALGTGSGQANEVYHVAGTLAAGTDTIDLTGGISDALGQAITFVEIVAVYFKNKSASNAMSLGGNINGPVLWQLLDTDETSLQFGQALMITASGAGWPIVVTTGDQLDINGTAADTYDLVLLGRNA